MITSTISDWTFEISHLITDKRYVVHSTRLKFYSDSDLNVTSEMIDHISSQHMALDVDKILDIKFEASSKRFLFKVSWLGFQSVEDTWEPFTSLWKDIPFVLVDYLEQRLATSDAPLVRKLLKLYTKIIHSTATKTPTLNISSLN